MTLLTTDVVTGILGQIAQYEALYASDTARFAEAHGADLRAAKLSAALGVVGDAAGALFGVLTEAVRQIAQANGDQYAHDYRRATTSATGAALKPAVEARLADWDSAAVYVITKSAELAYPRLPADADERLLREEARLVIDASPSVLGGLMALAGGARRDLAAVALSSWAATLAGAAGIDARDLGSVRAAALEASKEHGDERQAAAARLYRPSFGIIGSRVALTTAVGIVANMFAAVGCAVPEFDTNFAADRPFDLATWRDHGPQDGPPVTRPASF